MDALWIIPGFLAIAGLALYYLDKHRGPLPSKPPTSMVLPNTYKRYVGQLGPQSLNAFRNLEQINLSYQQRTTAQWLDEQAMGLVDPDDPREWEAS